MALVNLSSIYIKTIDNYIDKIHVVQVKVICKHIMTFIYIFEIDLRKKSKQQQQRSK